GLVVVALAMASMASGVSTAAGTRPGFKLRAGSTLASGSWLESRNGIYRLTMQPNGNPVISGEGVVIWETDTGGHPGADALMQGDGNFVVYQKRLPLWDSGTNGPGDAKSA